MISLQIFSGGWSSLINRHHDGYRPSLFPEISVIQCLTTYSSANYLPKNNFPTFEALPVAKRDWSL